MINNEEIFASTGGRPFDKNKPLIIFLHGSGFDHTVWMLQTRYFAFHGYSVLALDLPGHGLSKGECLVSIEDMARWIYKVIEKLGSKEVSLIGHSQGCLISLECAALYPNIIRSSVGCLFTTPIATGSTDEVIHFLKEHDIDMYCATLQASEYYHVQDFTNSTALVVGTEATGLSEAWRKASKHYIIIPMQGEIDSMNVSVAAGILIFEAKRQRRFK